MKKKANEGLMKVIMESNITDWAEERLVALLGDGNQNEALKGNVRKLALAVQDYLEEKAKRVSIGLNKSAQEGIEIFIESIVQGEIK